MTSKSPLAHPGGKKKLRHESDQDEDYKSKPPPVIRSRKPSSNQQGSRQRQGGPQDTDLLIGGLQDTDLLIQEVQPLMVDGKDLSGRFQEIIYHRGMKSSRRYQLIHTELRNFVSLQEKSQAEIASLKQEAQFAEATSQFEIATLKRQCLSLQKALHGGGKMLELGDANGDGHFTANCGSYTDDSATPNLLANVFSDTKATVTRFQKELFAAFKVGQDKTWDLLKPDQIVLARENHLGFYLKSVLNQMFFEGFENESFHTSHGVSRFLDPNLRQRNCYEYYLNNTGDIKDPQLGEFYEAKRSSLWERFPLYNGNDKKVCCFEELVGFELGLQLALSFKAALKSVWLLHKLAFSFEPPPSIFRVDKGADVDPAYMEAIVKLEDDQRFVSKVGFMVTPGLRLRKTVMRCEVYLSDATTTCDYNPNHGRSFHVGASADRGTGN